MRSSLLSACAALFLSASANALADATWNDYTYMTGPWQPPQLEVSKTGDIDPGLIFIPIRNNNTAGSAVTIYDNDGALVYQGPEEITMDFKMQKLFGKNVITFWSGVPKMSGGYGYGTVHILDETYREIYTVKLTGDFQTASGNTWDSYIDVHENTITPRNTIIVSAINVTQHDLSSVGGPVDGWMSVSQFYEIDIPTNEILYRWDALEHLDAIPLSGSRKSVPPNVSRELPWDCYHMNSVETTNEGFLISMRFYWTAFYLNQNGSVRWQLAVSITRSLSAHPKVITNIASFQGVDGGDFTGEDVRFSWQHHARIHNETADALVLSIFNNGNGLSVTQTESTGMAFEFDLTSMTGSLMHNLSDPTDSIESRTQGSFQFLGEAATSSHVVLGYGSTPKFREYDGAGNVVMTGQFGAMDVSEEYGESYRIFKFPWTATPFWNPVAVVGPSARLSDSEATIYMSWNGATEYDNWAVYSVPSKNSNATTLLTTVKRTGFESQALVSTLNNTFVKVAARKGSTVLRLSDAISL
ncbi:hypothetical protein N7466_010579 [Penicillium verhagenii]|uniref:uncharacterized protein n=1 Tax=Penicillium verhagenii TaxID=1562060 RepID=UPI0025459A76|nr:uncharacterized protein N7466_010579 [Penicillium verhagenii]KAJ5918587.1 hypothetical protein N7466_010579 [Penicillium verhagenii]